MVCSASYIIGHMKLEQEVDVFHTVQHVRTTRPQLITDLVNVQHVRTTRLQLITDLVSVQHVRTT